MESKFTGSLLGLFGVTILVALMTMFTFGIAFPWAICMYHKWYAKHTIIDGKQLYFDGTGAQLIGNWIKWLFLIFITFGIYWLWVNLRVKGWIVKHTHFVEVGFNG